MQNAIERRIVARPCWTAFAIRVSGSSKLRPVAAGHIAHYFVGRGDLVAHYGCGDVERERNFKAVHSSHELAALSLAHVGEAVEPHWISRPRHLISKMPCRLDIMTSANTCCFSSSSV
jgi:hypothetical protein